MTEIQGTELIELATGLYFVGRLLVFGIFLLFGSQIYFAVRKGMEGGD